MQITFTSLKKAGSSCFDERVFDFLTLQIEVDTSEGKSILLYFRGFQASVVAL